MSDLALSWGDDLQAGADGDFLIASSLDELNQRIIRRFLTNNQDASDPNVLTAAPDYIYDPSYGASARRYVDRNISDELLSTIQTTFLAGLALETEASNPTVSLTQTAVGIDLTATCTLANGQTLTTPIIEIASN